LYHPAAGELVATEAPGAEQHLAAK